MLDRRWAQVAGIAGILFFVFILGTILTGGSVDTTSSAADIASYVTQHHTAVAVNSLLGVAGSSVILLFFVPLAQIVRERDGGSPLGTIILVSGTSLVALTMLANLPQAALAMASTQPGGLGNASTVAALWDLGLQIVIPGGTGFLFTIFLGAIGIAMLQRAFAATWLGWLSVVIGIVWVPTDIAGILTNNQTYMGTLGILSLAGFGIVVVATSVYLLRYRPAAGRSPAPRRAEDTPLDAGAPAPGTAN